MPPPVSRVEAVQALRALAAKYGVDRVPDRASRARVGTMVDELLAVETLSVEDKAQVEEAVAQHAASYGDRVPAAAPPPEAHQADEEDASPKLWKLRAAQVTYNSTEGEWASASIAVLLGLFERLKAFACPLASFLKAMGTYLSYPGALDGFWSSRPPRKHTKQHVDIFAANAQTSP